MTRAIPRQLLFGPYKTPRFRYGTVAFCEVRGEVRITRLSNGHIPWPMTTRKGGKPSLIVYGGLASAVRRESSLAVAYWWGISVGTVSQWRRALDVPRARARFSCALLAA